MIKDVIYNIVIKPFLPSSVMSFFTTIDWEFMLKLLVAMATILFINVVPPLILYMTTEKFTPTKFFILIIFTFFVTLYWVSQVNNL